MTSFSTRLLDATEPARAALLAIPTLQRGAGGALPLASYVAFPGEAYHRARMFHRLYGDLLRTLPVPATGAPIPPRTTEETRHA
jgi:hypothetical protein